MDRRVKYTKQIIKDTFLNLLKTKELSKITVSEICKIADVNRATFYRYYLDVYDLLDHIQNEFIDELKNTCMANDIEYSVSSFTEELLTIFLANKDLVSILFSTKNNIYFLNEVLEVAYDKCRKKWLSDIPNLSESDIEYASIFIFNGALGVVNYWVKNNFDKDVSEIGNIIEQLSYFGTKKFIYKK